MLQVPGVAAMAIASQPRCHYENTCACVPRKNLKETAWQNSFMAGSYLLREQIGFSSGVFWNLSSMKTEVKQLFVQYSHTLACRVCRQPCVSAVLRECLFDMGMAMGAKSLSIRARWKRGGRALLWSPCVSVYELWLIVYAKTSKD